MDEKIEISELQSRINLLLNLLCKVKRRLSRTPEIRKAGNVEIRIIRKSANLKSIRSRRQFQQLETAAFVAFVGKVGKYWIRGLLETKI